ncbi:MAG: Asp23/Gls24 family envelope stress response protein [Erysipelotrichaceae bacterium]|nr:Asp23/Gls24 family envelope stress response protein [Erysipelotrichaceae bacterium]
MAHEYYSFDQGSVNGKIMMNVKVFDEIIKKTVNEMKNVSLDTSKGFAIPGTKAVVACSIKDNDVYICIHVRIKYGIKISTLTKEIQEKIATAIKQMTGVDVKKIDIEVDNIEFD